MNAVHVTHTAPFFARSANMGKTYSISDYELLTTILSALKFRELNGNIGLYTDSIGYKYYEQQKMLKIWNSGINVDVLNNINDNVDFEIFWAAGKIYALKHQQAPCIIMDTDFIVWINISEQITNKKDVICIHREELNPNVYLPKELLKVSPNYNFNPNFDWSENPCNTAFVYFGNENLKQYFVEEAIKFMKDNLYKPEEFVSQMVFAEQRLLPMCAKNMEVVIKSFVDLNELFIQDSFTHLWGYKRELEADHLVAYNYCSTLVERLINDFDKDYKYLRDIPVIKKYL